MTKCSVACRNRVKPGAELPASGFVILAGLGRGGSDANVRKGPVIVAGANVRLCHWFLSDRDKVIIVPAMTGVIAPAMTGVIAHEAASGSAR